ncbi:MAG TPA: GNAT family N-acetyltransferase [Bacteroidota bacterium]|nr:GNAT family N-acetyltransferase [Bacteroidota bacterium]
MSPFSIRIEPAKVKDVPLIFEFIQGLAEYERLAHSVVATEMQVRKSLFGRRKYAEVLLAKVGRQAAGFALYFHNYSTFLAQPGIYLEDLFVKPEFRGKGIGKALLVRLAQIALERDCGRLEWAVLDWNASAIDFYRKLGAVHMKDWDVYRLTGEQLEKLAQES